MKWATRRGVHVDRAACAWLIRRWIDPDAEFSFVDDPDCSFETILRRADLNDPALWDIARIVHEADLDDERYDAPEAPGLDVICRGLSMVHDDPDVLAVSGAIFDGLYEHRRRALLLGREPA